MKRLKLFAAAVVAMMALALGLACSKSGTAVRSQMETAQEIAKLEQQIDAKQEQVNTLMRQYVQAGGQDVGAVLGQGLTPDQAAFLEKKLRNEEGIGYRDLISQILDTQKAADDLKVKVQDLERSLPAPVDVTKGERHIDIAMNYLVKDKGLDPATAKSLVQKVNLMDELVPGFKVWNFYQDGVYGTFVTQGTASVSPYGVIQHNKQVLVAAKDKAISERDALAKEKAALNDQVADLETKRDQLTQEVTLLQAEKQDLTTKVADLQTQRDDLEAQNNSVFYRIGARKELVQEGMVRDPWYAKPMLAKFAPADYPQHMDLRSQDTLVFSAKDAGVARITKVKLAPGSLYKEGADYAVTVAGDGSQASVRFLNKDKFRAGRSIMILVD